MKGGMGRMWQMMRKLVDAFTKYVNLSFFNSMRTKLTSSFLLLTLFPIIIITIFVLNISVATLKNEISSYVSRTLEQVSNNIDNSFSQLADMAASIGLDAGTQQVLKKDADRPLVEKIRDDEAVSDILKNATASFTEIESLRVFSYNGEVYSLKGITSSLPAEYNFTRQSWFEKMKQLGEKSLIIPTRVQTDSIVEGKHRKVFGYITEINDIETKKNIGYIMFEMDINMLDNLLQGVASDALSQLIIIDDNKTVIYHTAPDYISTQYRTSYVSEMLAEKSGSMTHKTEDSEEVVTFYTSANTGWTVLSVMPANILFSRINSFELALVYTLVLCVVSAAVIAVLMSRTLTEPISLLKSRMKMAESGDFDVQIKVKSHDEIGALSLSFNKMLSRIKDLIQRVYQTEIVRKEAELSALQAQINPHFLYNTLQIMDIMAEEKGADEISGACQALAKIFRYSISRGRELVTLEEELIHVENYVYIQTLRMGRKLSVQYDVSQKLRRYEVIKLILQPLVENAIIHGIERSGKQCVIRIVAFLEGENLILSVEDNGVGMDEEELARVQASLYQDVEENTSGKNGGIALKNVHYRIKLYNNEKFGLSIQSKKNVGTKITLILPARIHKNPESENDGGKVSYCG